MYLPNLLRRLARITRDVLALNRLIRIGFALAVMLEISRANVLTLSCKSATGGLASSGAPLAAHPIMPVQAARRRANSTCRRRLGRREQERRLASFNAELARANTIVRRVPPADPSDNFQKRAANRRILI